MKGFDEKGEFDMVRLMNPKKVVVTMGPYVRQVRICVRHRYENGSIRTRDIVRENGGDQNVPGQIHM